MVCLNYAGTVQRNEGNVRESGRESCRRTAGSRYFSAAVGESIFESCPLHRPRLDNAATTHSLIHVIFVSTNMSGDLADRFLTTRDENLELKKSVNQKEQEISKRNVQIRKLEANLKNAMLSKDPSALFCVRKLSLHIVRTFH
jgi:hypothetical protein